MEHLLEALQGTATASTPELRRTARGRGRHWTVKEGYVDSRGTSQVGHGRVVMVDRISQNGLPEVVLQERGIAHEIGGGNDSNVFGFLSMMEGIDSGDFSHLLLVLLSRYGTTSQPLSGLESNPQLSLPPNLKPDLPLLS